jgi:hypothetical protein
MGEIAGREIYMEEQVDIVLCVSLDDMAHFLSLCFAGAEQVNPSLAPLLSLAPCACVTASVGDGRARAHAAGQVRIFAPAHNRQPQIKRFGDAELHWDESEGQ